MQIPQINMQIYEFQTMRIINKAYLHNSNSLYLHKIR